MSDDAFICARCALVNPTCCRTDPAASARCFPLSGAERDRLLPHAAALGVPASESEDNTPEFLGLMGVLFPGRRATLAKTFPAGGQHLRLPLDKDGNCLFLQEYGCFLPREARPWYCQIFPLWVYGKYFDRFAPEACLLTREAARMDDVFTALGISRENAKTLYLALCRDWGMENDDA